MKNKRQKAQRASAAKIKIPFIDWFVVRGKVLRDIEQGKIINDKINRNLLAINEYLRKRLKRYE